MSKDMALKVLGLCQGKGQKKPKKITDYSEDEILGAFQTECHALRKFNFMNNFLSNSHPYSCTRPVYRLTELSRGIPSSIESAEGQEQLHEESRGQERKANTNHGTSRKSFVHLETEKFFDKQRTGG